MKIENFDYGSLTKEQKKVVIEIMELLRKSNQENMLEFADVLKHKFNVEEIPMEDTSKSWLLHILKKENVNHCVQGFNLENVNTKNVKKYPIILIQDDIRTLEKAFEKNFFEKLNVK
jgi:hypothetical protein